MPAVQTTEEKATGGWHYLGDSEDVSVHKGFGAELPKKCCRGIPVPSSAAESWWLKLICLNLSSRGSEDFQQQHYLGQFSIFLHHGLPFMPHA